MRWPSAFLLLFTLACGAGAHPIPRMNHDRAVTIRLTPAALAVDYRLDLDEFTAVFSDLPAVLGKEQLARLQAPREFYEAFANAYGPILADNLIARLDGDLLKFKCVRHTQRFRDDDGQPLDHLRFDFRFEAAWPNLKIAQHRFEFRDGTYELEEGQVHLSLQAEPPLVLLDKTEPDKALQDRPAKDLAPGDDDKRRTLAATIDRPGVDPAPAPSTATTLPPLEDPTRASHLDRLLDSRQVLWVLLCLAFGFGAVHALTPGHGKTLVGAYLVGERGTAWHAVLLGLVTTLTHTGSVIALTVVLLAVYGDAAPTLRVQTLLRLVGGALVAGLGLWLLFRRLAGQADHVHFGGGHHHHHGHAHRHHHHVPAEGGILGLVLLGIGGGIIPCGDAILIFGGAVSTGRPLWLALHLLLAFSAGLAGVLILAGILVVRLKGFAGSRWGEHRLFQALPVLSAALVTIMGLWLCYHTLHRPGG